MKLGRKVKNRREILIGMGWPEVSLEETWQQWGEFLRWAYGCMTVGGIEDLTGLTGLRKDFEELGIPRRARGKSNNAKPVEFGGRVYLYGYGEVARELGISYCAARGRVIRSKRRTTKWREVESRWKKK